MNECHCMAFGCAFSLGHLMMYGMCIEETNMRQELREGIA